MPAIPPHAAATALSWPGGYRTRGQPVLSSTKE